MVKERSVLGEVSLWRLVDGTEVIMLAWVTTAYEKYARRKSKDSYATLIDVGLVGT